MRLNSVAWSLRGKSGYPRASENLGASESEFRVRYVLQPPSRHGKTPGTLRFQAPSTRGKCEVGKPTGAAVGTGTITLSGCRETRLAGCVIRRPGRGGWRGYPAYHAVPTNSRRTTAFAFHVVRHWRRTLMRRSQKAYVPWRRMKPIAARWIPSDRIRHPARYPSRQPGPGVPPAGRYRHTGRAGPTHGARCVRSGRGARARCRRDRRRAPRCGRGSRPGHAARRGVPHHAAGRHRLRS